MDWNFTSATVDSETPAALPLLAVRFAPRVDDHNRTSSVLVPVTVERNAGGTGRLTKLQASYDKGSTWRTVPVITVNGKTVAVVKPARDATSVSLKASASDSAGNTVEQTIIDAYLLK